MENPDIETTAPVEKLVNKGGRPKTKPVVDSAAVMSSPEVQAMIADAVQAATAKIIADLETRRAAAQTPANTGDAGFAQTLALELARVADQGSKQKRVAPAEMVRRENARELMELLIVEARANDETAQYDLLRETYLEERLVKPSYIDANHVQKRTRINWAGVPNEAMQPVNEIARKIHTAFIDSIGGTTPSVNHTRNASNLSVLHADGASAVPPVGRPRGSLEIVGRDIPGQIVETNVLGSIAAPARQIA